MRSSKRKVIFNKSNNSSATTSTTHPRTSCPSQKRSRPPQESTMVSSHDETGISFDIPAYLRQRPPIHDRLVTRSSKEQDETVEKCLPFLLGIEDPTRNPFDFNEFGVPRLERIDHVEFLIDGLESLYPPEFAGLDAARPWMVYWAMNGLSIMGHDVSKYRKE